MQWYPWLDYIYFKILSSYKKNIGHHALLLHNKWDHGEDVLIFAITRWLMCAHPDAVKCCNVCYNCQLMNAGNHPDYYQIDVVDDNVQTVGIDVIRSCISMLYTHAHQNKAKVLFIKNVESLTHHAVNALLKLLEEPPINTYFFLKTREYDRVLNTLLSRCMQWSIMPPEEKIGLRWLMNNKGIDDVVLATCALRLCNGAPIEAENMFKSNFWAKRLILCDNLYHAILRNNFLKILPSLNVRYKTVSIYWLITLITDSIKWQHKVEKRFLINLDQLKLIIMIANRWSMFSLHKQLQQWLIVLRYCKKFNNINYKLLLIYRLLNWQYNVIEHCLYSWDI